MLTFEKVFSVFESFLAENGIYEAVQTSQGHTILDDLTGYLEYKATLGRRDLTYEDMAQVSAQRQEYIAKLG